MSNYVKPNMFIRFGVEKTIFLLFFYFFLLKKKEDCRSLSLDSAKRLFTLLFSHQKARRI